MTSRWATACRLVVLAYGRSLRNALLWHCGTGPVQYSVTVR